jgi:hypothetical protein
VKRDTIKCLQSWADELLSRADRVRNLIGDAHWLSDGHHKEELVRDFLRRHLPPSLRVTRGFICPAAEASAVSPEVDILVSDAEGELPWFVEGGLAIVAPSAARAQLHVKTEFGPSELADVFAGTFRVHESCGSELRPFSLWSGAIFFARSNYANADACSTALSTAVRKYIGEPADLRRTRFLPDCIAIIDGPVALLTHPSPSETGVERLNLKMFECDRLAAAVLLSHFYDSVAERGRNLARRGEWVQVLQKQDYRILSDETVEAR